MVRSVLVPGAGVSRGSRVKTQEEQRTWLAGRRGGCRCGWTRESFYLPSDSTHGRRTRRYVRTGLRFGWTVAVGNRGPSATNPNQNRVNRARLHLTTAHDRLRSAAGFPAAAAAFRALVHVQLTRLHRTATTGCCTATPGALYASPHPLHSTTGVRLTNLHPTPPRPEGRPASTGVGEPRLPTPPPDHPEPTNHPPPREREARRNPRDPATSSAYVLSWFRRGQHVRRSAVRVVPPNAVFAVNCCELSLCADSAGRMMTSCLAAAEPAARGEWKAGMIGGGMMISSVARRCLWFFGDVCIRRLMGEVCSVVRVSAW